MLSDSYGPFQICVAASFYAKNRFPIFSHDALSDTNDCLLVTILQDVTCGNRGQRRSGNASTEGDYLQYTGGPTTEASVVVGSRSLRHQDPFARTGRQRIEAGGISSAVAAVATKQSARIDAIGLADLATSRPMRVGRIFQIASITKPLTAAAGR
jgi:hypothetical protein